MHGKPVRREFRVIDCVDGGRLRTRPEERHVQLLRRDALGRQRVRGHESRHLASGPHQHFRVNAEVRRDALRDRTLERGGLGGATAEHDVAALEIRLHVRVSEVVEQRAQLSHRDAVARTQVDAAQQRDE